MVARVVLTRRQALLTMGRCFLHARVTFANSASSHHQATTATTADHYQRATIRDLPRGTCQRASPPAHAHPFHERMTCENDNTNLCIGETPCTPRAKSKPPVAVLALGRSLATVMCWIVTNSRASEEWSPRCNVTSHNTSFPIFKSAARGGPMQPTHIHTHDDRRGEAYENLTLSYLVHSLDPRVHSPVRRGEVCVRQDCPHTRSVWVGSRGLLSSGSCGRVGAFFSLPVGRFQLLFSTV
jgi:hypothetical protein